MGFGADTKAEHRTAVVRVRLAGADYRRAHDACHLAGGLWNQAVAWVRDEWNAGRDPSRYDIRAFLTGLDRSLRPLHAHTTEEIAYDLKDAISTYRTNRRAGMQVRAPWRVKNYRPLSFSTRYGWRLSKAGKLSLSLGRGRAPLVLPLPVVVDSSSGEPVPTALWGEIHLCWDRDARAWALHIAYRSSREHPPAPAERIVAIDEGIINPMALASYTPGSTTDAPVIDVLVINGREARSVKRRRNKTNGSIQRALSRTKAGSRRYRHLVRAKRRNQARTRLD